MVAASDSMLSAPISKSPYSISNALTNLKYFLTNFLGHCNSHEPSNCFFLNVFMEFLFRMMIVVDVEEYHVINSVPKFPSKY